MVELIQNKLLLIMKVNCNVVPKCMLTLEFGNAWSGAVRSVLIAIDM